METQDSMQNGLPAPPQESVAPSVETAITDNAGDLTPAGIRSSPPAIPEKALMVLDVPHGSPEDKAAKSDSEAETIVLPGKNGYSPSKTRKSIKHEDQSEEGEIREEDLESREGLAELKHAVPSSSNMYSSLGKRKRTKQGKSKDDQIFAGNTSGLSSLPTSPATSRSKPLRNDSDHSRSPSPHTIPHKANSVDRLLSRNNIAEASSGDEGEPRKHKRQQSVGGTGNEASAQRKHENHRTTKSQPNSGEKTRKHTRSESPPPRTHRRISSAQTTASAINGLSHKKKRVPAPLLPTREEYHSDESSASGSPHPRSSRLRKLATPATAESALSAIVPLGKMGKNRRDGIGRTPLARACAAEEGYDTAKQILDASHEDLNLADNAGNTPLQIACLGGYADIVKLLIDHGCDITCVNMDKDTPLLDAVENGHLDVVKLLLEAGVNPRRGNVKGEEPLDRLAPDMDNSEEIREVLIAARLKCAETRRPSEDHSTHDVDDRSSRGTSPRHSPPMQQPEDLYTGRRRRANGRSQKTRNELLWQSMDTNTLRDAAGKGDTETVNRILQVRDNMADTESLVRATRGGHEDVIQLLLAIGGANADPPPLPLKSSAPEYATPMLAAIGREKIEVVKLLLDQPNFDPTKKFQGKTYYEIARGREGPRWREEEGLLREAYYKYAGESKESSSRPHSPEARRDSDRSGKRPNERTETTSPIQKPKLSSPETLHNDSEPRAKTSSGTNDGAKRDPKKSSPSSDNQPKNSSGFKKSVKNKKDEHFQSTQMSEREPTLQGQARPKPMKKRSEPDTAHPTSDNDPVKPRRKLMSGKELKGEKEKQRRESVVSTASNSGTKDRAGSRMGDSNKTDAPVSGKSTTLHNTTNYVEPDLGLDKLPDRPRTLKRDDSKDRLGAIRGDSPAKRPRESPTPPRAGSHDSTRTAEDGSLPTKKRRLDSEGHASSSPDNRTNSSLLSSENSRSKSSTLLKERHRQGSLASQGHGKFSEGHSELKKTATQIKRPTTASSSNADNTRTEKVLNPGAPHRGQRESAETKDSAKAAEQKAAEEREAKLKAEREERNRQEAEKLEAERRRLEAEKAEAEERARLEAQAKLEEERLKQQRAEEERQAAEKRARELQEEQAREHEARLRHMAKIKQEEAERRERQAREDAEAKARAEEERRRVYLEQEQKKREEAERKRAAREAEARAERERQEAERRAKLPQLLQSFETFPMPQTPEFASLFKDIIGVRYDTMGYGYNVTGPDSKELWILNTQVAFLLGFKDLQLSRYTAWDRIPASNIAKTAIFKIEGDRYACTAPHLRPLNPEGRTNISRTIELRNANLRLFMNLDLFFVKLSEFLYIVPNFPHLRHIKMSVTYKELPKEDGSEWKKWKEEPGAGPFCPQPTYYINGRLVGEDKIQYAQGRSTPFPRPVPTAPRDPDNMIARLSVDSPRYADACRAQGLWHLLPEEERDAMLSNRGMDGRSFTGNGNAVVMNGFTPSPSAPSERSQEKFQYQQGREESYGSPRLVNGVNGDDSHGRH